MRDYFAVFFTESLRITLPGYFFILATRQCPFGLSRVPSSNDFMITAFRLALRPWRRITALFGFRNVTISTLAPRTPATLSGFLCVCAEAGNVIFVFVCDLEIRVCHLKSKDTTYDFFCGFKIRCHSMPKLIHSKLTISLNINMLSCVCDR